HWFVILDNGSRLSMEEYIAFTGGKAVPINQYTPAGLATASLGVIALPGEAELLRIADLENDMPDLYSSTLPTPVPEKYK
ncbi:hypothetical protein LMP62_14390, partial [Staphylococcus aureus]|uniref:hypothetical protein n=1 Tax=Staphylococcus aureus TaxID=1280 RepID=UPI001E3565CD